jgi:hypothetical protein
MFLMINHLQIPFYEETASPLIQQPHKHRENNFNLLSSAQSMSQSSSKVSQSGFVHHRPVINQLTIRDNDTLNQSALTEEITQKATNDATVPAIGSLKQTNIHTSNRWCLGILSQKPPKEIMKEMFRALRVLNFVCHTYIHTHSTYNTHSLIQFVSSNIRYVR